MLAILDFILPMLALEIYCRVPLHKKLALHGDEMYLLVNQCLLL